MMAAALMDVQIRNHQARGLNSDLYTSGRGDSPGSGSGEPLRIGSQRQSFIDRWIVEDASEVLFTVMPKGRNSM